MNPRDPQRLGVGGEPREADVELVVDLEHPLEVGRDRLELHAEPAVAGDREAVLPHHRHHGGPVVLEDLRGAGVENPSGIRDPEGGEEGTGGAVVGGTHRHGRSCGEIAEEGSLGASASRSGAEQRGGSSDGGGLFDGGQVGLLGEQEGPATPEPSESDLSLGAVCAQGLFE